MNNVDFIANLLAKTRAPNGPVEMGPSQVSTDVMPRTALPPIAPTYYGGAPAIGGINFSNDDRATAPAMPPPVDLSQYNLESPANVPPEIGPRQFVPQPPMPQIGNLSGAGPYPDYSPSDLTPQPPMGRVGGPNYTNPFTSMGAPVTGEVPTPSPTGPVAPAGLPNIGGDTLLSEQTRQLGVLDDPHRFDKPIYETTVDGKTERTSDRKKYEKWKAEGRDVKTIQEAGVNRNKKWSWWEKLGAGALGWLTGGLAGGIKAATDRNYFQKIGDARQREMLLPQIGRQQQIASTNAAIKIAETKPILAQQELQRKVRADKDRFDRQTRALDLQGQRIANAKERYKVTVDEDGLRWKEFPNDPAREKEPVMDPVTREQDQDPRFKLYDVISPETGTPIQVTGNTLFAGESARTAANVGITNKDIEDERERQLKLGTTGAALTAVDTEISQLTNANDAYRQELKLLNPSSKSEVERARFKQLNDLIADNDKKHVTAQAKKKQLEGEKAELSKPLQKRQRAGGKYVGIVVPGPADLRGDFPGKSDEEISAIFLGQGGKFSR